MPRPLVPEPGWKQVTTKKTRVCHWFRAADTSTADPLGQVFETSLCGRHRHPSYQLGNTNDVPRCGACNERYKDGKR